MPSSTQSTDTCESFWSPLTNLTCTCVSVLGIKGVGFFGNVTHYYTSSKLTMYHYKWLKIVCFNHIKYVSSWRKHNVLFYSYAVTHPRNLSLQTIRYRVMCILNTHVHSLRPSLKICLFGIAASRFLDLGGRKGIFFSIFRT